MKLEDMGPGAVKGLGLDDESTCFKRKFRWLFTIKDISAEGINALAPHKSARPTITFKEIEAQHLTETIYYPGKPDWKPVALTLYDLKKDALSEEDQSNYKRAIDGNEIDKYKYIFNKLNSL